MTGQGGPGPLNALNDDLNKAAVPANWSSPPARISSSPAAIMPVIAGKLNGTWTRLLASERLRRSSQVLSVIDQKAYIFGGEILPRQPVDSQLDVISVGAGAANHETKSLNEAPSPRVGSASAVVNGKLVLFSGRGGTDMAPVEEKGAVWAWDPAQSAWSLVRPADASKPYPPARSYHTATSDGETSYFIHAGCPEKGRLSDLWKFDLSSKTWSQAADAPGPQRGGTSIAYSGGKLYRMNGFDGQTEVGGSIDVYDISSNTWSSETFQADGNSGPEPRSVCTLLPLRVRNKDKLMTLFGERDPSSLGHAGAGKMLGDVWLYDIAEKWWTHLQPSGDDGTPDPRGWFDADVLKAESGSDGVLVHGGLGENNERLTDVWHLSF
ncbi:galactose oxidase [Corynespora cassiicola Philippines]|uniref:Galactose oxidase n=1 Tax=Corynespora cassiicola Philippines TaxID=1448308 RepID=A0A2T2P4L8_CORCC|nr:galactose oxidase [Corynespora cassiicola Philippines]